MIKPVLFAAAVSLFAAPAFAADAEKRHWTIVPTSYDKAESFYKKAAAATPPDVIKELQGLFQ